jgi:hypothetical protein
MDGVGGSSPSPPTNLSCYSGLGLGCPACGIRSNRAQALVAGLSAAWAQVVASSQLLEGFERANDEPVSLKITACSTHRWDAQEQSRSGMPREGQASRARELTGEAPKTVASHFGT